MKKQLKRLLGILLCIVMIFSRFAIMSVVADTYEGTESPYDCPPQNAFDARPESKWCTEMGADGAFLQQNLSKASKAYGYYFCTGKDTNEYPGRNPTSWKISASNDGTNWTVIETVTGDATLERASMKFYYFYFDTPTAQAYSYYRFDFTAIGDGTVIQLSEVSIITEELYEKIQSTASYTFIDGTLSAYQCPPENLLDGQTGTKWCFDFYEDGEFITWKMNAPTSISGYRMATGDDSGEAWGAGRQPVSWILYGSLDGENWNVIDQREDDTTIQNVNCQYFDFYLDAPSAQYIYFKFCPLKSGDRTKWLIQLSEFELIRNTADVATSKNAPQAFDGVASTVWTAAKDAAVVEWSYVQAKLMTEYSLTAGTNANAVPKSWKLYGADNGGEWVLLDEVTNDTVLNANETKAYALQNVTAVYTAFKLEITATKGDAANVELAEIAPAFKTLVTIRGLQKGVASGDQFNVRLGASVATTEVLCAGFIIKVGQTEKMVSTETYYKELKGTVGGSVKTVVSNADFNGEALVTAMIDAVSATGKTVYTVTP